jgi:hypothetical protein
MSAVAKPHSPGTTHTVGLASIGRRNSNALNRRLAAILLAVVATAFFVLALTARPPSGIPGPHTPSVGHPGPPSYGEILSRLNHNAAAPTLAAPRSANAP